MILSRRFRGPSLVTCYIDAVHQRYGIELTREPEWGAHAQGLRNKLGWDFNKTSRFIEWAVLSESDSLKVPSILSLWYRLHDWYAWRKQTEKLSSRLTVLAAVVGADRREPKGKINT